jgi:dimeric dUTPase (all-alpha-NTP-PPase superfamily)
MNINDITTDIEIPENIWASIFEEQNKLAEKYSEIEGMGDLLKTKNKNLDTAKGQKWIKDFAWRFTEELAESHEAFLNGYEDHRKEELIDALHFLTEMSIIAGFYPVKPKKVDNPVGIWEIVYRLGLSCNCLKNKPWKQSHMLTDRNKYNEYLQETWDVFYTFLIQIGMSDREIFLTYFKKKEVNKFRIRSKY